MYDEEIEERVRKRVEAKAKFMKHFATFLVFAAFFFILNGITSGFAPRNWWWYWPVLGWGLGVAIHYVNAVGFPGTHEMIERWEIEETARELKKRRKTKALPEAEREGLDLPELERERHPNYDDEDFV